MNDIKDWWVGLSEELQIDIEKLQIDAEELQIDTEEQE